MNTKVTILKDYKGKFNKGDPGFIDGYVNSSSGVPCAVVVINKRFDVVPLYALETV